MRHLACFPLLFVTLTACAPNHDESSDAATGRDVRAFAATVAHDITRDGPTAWRRFFPNSPDFYMVSDGVLAFPDGESAAKGIDALPSMIKQITLEWSDIRVDPLGPGLASMGAHFHELRSAPNGSRTEESGYFTAVVDSHNGRWQFRNAHWSTPRPETH
jgi:hypothetical protein